MLTTSPLTSTAFFYWSSILLLLSLSLVHDTQAATPDEWRSRSIYQLITDRFALEDGSITSECDTGAELYCGGSWQGIINKLDYIQGMGFTAIWISPVVKNINATVSYGQGYHGFWTQDITQLNDHFGTVDDLKALSTAVHDRGMYLMIDVVINDMAYAGAADATDFSTFTPFDKAEYFHPYCPVDYSNDTSAERCWLGDNTVALADLDTESPFVMETFQTWVGEMVANYSLDGLRIDAAKHVDHAFWAPFQQAAGVFSIGEVFDNSASDTCYWMDDALDSVLNYPAWYSLVTILPNSTQSMIGLGWQFNQNSVNCYDTTVIGTFSENHDVARFANATDDLSQQKNAIVWDMMTDGIPVVYYGAEQRMSGGNDPYNRGALWLNGNGYDTNAPLYQHVATLNAGRTAVNNAMAASNYSNWSPYWAYKASVLYNTDDILVFRKGYDVSLVSALTNVGVAGAQVGPYLIGDTNWDEGALIIEILNCSSVVAGNNGQFNITLVSGEPQVWIPGKALVNTTLCPTAMKNVNKTTSSSSSSSAPPSLSTLSSSITIITSICTLVIASFLIP